MAARIIGTGRSLLIWNVTLLLSGSGMLDLVNAQAQNSEICSILSKHYEMELARLKAYFASN
jgi:hypothetical protein